MIINQHGVSSGGGGTWQDISSAFSISSDNTFEVSAVTDGVVVMFSASTTLETVCELSGQISITIGQYWPPDGWVGNGNLFIYGADSGTVTDWGIYVDSGLFEFGPTVPFDEGATVLISGVWIPW